MKTLIRSLKLLVCIILIAGPCKGVQTLSFLDKHHLSVSEVHLMTHLIQRYMSGPHKGGNEQGRMVIASVKHAYSSYLRPSLSQHGVTAYLAFSQLYDWKDDGKNPFQAPLAMLLTRLFGLIEKTMDAPETFRFELMALMEHGSRTLKETAHGLSESEKLTPLFEQFITHLSLHALTTFHPSLTIKSALKEISTKAYRIGTGILDLPVHLGSLGFRALINILKILQIKPGMPERGMAHYYRLARIPGRLITASTLIILGFLIIHKDKINSAMNALPTKDDIIQNKKEKLSYTQLLKALMTGGLSSITDGINNIFSRKGSSK